MEGLIVRDTESGAGDNKVKGGKIAKGSSIGSTSRKRLSDISNLQHQQPKPAIQQVKQQFDSLTNKEYVDNLQKENRTLMKLLADRNKIIELSRIELQSLRINLQKVQQQNLQLAQANSQMLGELSSGKDRLKALQHELACRNGLLKVRKLEAEEREKRGTCQNTENEVYSAKYAEAGESLQADKENGPCTKRERQPNNRPLGTPTVEVVQVKAKADSKRLLRRQSARFKTEDLFETNGTNGEKVPVSPLCDNLVHESGPICSLVEKKDPTIEAIQAKEKPGNKRRLTRQSARFKTEEREATEELFETNGNKFPVSPPLDNVVHESGPTCSLLEKETPTIEAVQAKEKPDNKRRLTRQSARFKTEEREATEDLFETNGDKFPVSLCDNVVHESGPTCSSVEKEDEGYSAPRSEGQECRRSSTRPLRRAAGKITSYKEISIKVKMRRDF
ncbi:SHUGOSHIN 2 isoform X1 [Prunus avium]|uniref:SHUGOSHIN 2 isoform X1 n=1 Tax=Prunus avium TaxID=42229 RepID=A0A6P5TAR1_PRUAV|nr:SHUGOSHIN 2 isoform X1 [Prunus avium]